YVVPTGRVIVPTGWYVVHTGRVIVATGRYVVPAGSENDSDDASIHNEATNTQQQPNIQPQIITTVSNNNAKFPYLKKDKYEVWAIKMKYWITNNDMNIWKVIQNGNNMKKTGRDHDGRVIILPPMTIEEHIVVQRESKARTTLLQSIPDDHVANFYYMDDARDIWNAVKARFGGNVESKKMKKSMLKQEFLKFRIGETEGFHKGYDRMQKILSQLNQLKPKPNAKDINLKFLRALPSSWSQVALTLKTKGGLELLSFDDLYYKLKTLEVDVKGHNTISSSQSAGPSHFVFVSATSTSKKMSYGDSPNYSSSTTYSVPSNSKTRSHRSEKLDLEEMDLKWQMAMLSVRVHKFEQKARRKIDFDKKESAGSTRRSESDGVIAAKEFGMITGYDSEDAIKEGYVIPTGRVIVPIGRYVVPTGRVIVATGRKLKAKRDIGLFDGYSKDSAVFRVYNKQTRKIHESVNVNFNEISEMASKQFSLEFGLSNLNERITKLPKSNVETSNTEEEVFHEFPLVGLLFILILLTFQLLALELMLPWSLKKHQVFNATGEELRAARQKLMLLNTAVG
nr:ribonuclease H-like domain-containing protein [Tanacetum cinerariifolium]